MKYYFIILDEPFTMNVGAIDFYSVSLSHIKNNFGVQIHFNIFFLLRMIILVFGDDDDVDDDRMVFTVVHGAAWWSCDGGRKCLRKITLMRRRLCVQDLSSSLRNINFHRHNKTI